MGSRLLVLLFISLLTIINAIICTPEMMKDIPLDRQEGKVVWGIGLLLLWYTGQQLQRQTDLSA